MTTKLFAIAVFTGSLTTFFSILALSLNYWQGGTLKIKEILKSSGVSGGIGGAGGLGGLGDIGGGAGSVGGGNNVVFNPAEGFQSLSTTMGSFADMSDMRDMIMSETPSDNIDFAMNTVVNLHGGIWHLCVSIVEYPGFPGLDIPEFCMYLQNIPVVYMPPNNVWIQADWAVPRAMLFLGMFCILGSVLCVVVKWMMMTDKSCLLSVAACLALVAGIFFVAGFSVFVDTMKIELLNYQSAFYLCVLSWLLSWFTASVIIFTRVTNKDLDIA